MSRLVNTSSPAAAGNRSSQVSPGQTGVGLAPATFRGTLPNRHRLRHDRRSIRAVPTWVDGTDLEAIRTGLASRTDEIQDAIYTIAALDTTAAAKTGFFTEFAKLLESVLTFYQSKLDSINVPYSYGWSIVLLTLTVKLATFPLVKQQVESSMAVQNLKPRLDAIKARYADDDKRIKKETSLLYEKANVNPLAGCLPSIATIPIFIGLYRSLSNAAEEGIFNNQGFYWIPSLAGPTSVAARQAGTGTAWLFPFVDGAPPIGWEEARLYLVLPVMLVAAQFWSASILKPPVDPDNEQAKTTAQIVKFLPLMIGWFSLNVPSGLSLYYFSNTVLTSAQQIFLRKLGGASVDEVDLGPIKNLGSARRNGTEWTDEEVIAYLSTPVMASSVAAGIQDSSPSSNQDAAAQEAVEVPEMLLQRRSKRSRKTPMPQHEEPSENGTTITVSASGGNLEDEFPTF